MADKKPSGFKTFLLFFVTIGLALFAGFLAYLMLVPNATLFGIKYASNTKTVVIEKVLNDSRNIFKFSDYAKIVVNANAGKGHTNIEINYASPTNMSNSQIVLAQKTLGFMREGAKTAYEITATKNGSELLIDIVEPEYNFLQITNQTVLKLNVYGATDSVLGATFEIKTGSGSVTIGGKQVITDSSQNLVCAGMNVETKTGSILFSDQAIVNGLCSLKTETGNVTVQNDKVLSSLTLQSRTGKINAKNITANLNLVSDTSHVTLGNVLGNVNVDIRTGILHFGNITGNLISENHLIYTKIVGGDVTGEVTLVNEDGHFEVNLGTISGAVSIRTGNNNVKIGEVAGTCSIETINGAINVKKASTNSQQMVLKTNGGGITFNFQQLLGTNMLTTTSGGINVAFGTEASFRLKADSTNGQVFRTWLDDTTKPIDQTVGQVTGTTLLDIKSTNGNIKIDRV